MKYATERKLYTLTCITPVHVGCGESLFPAEYLYDRKAQKVYFFSSSKLQMALFKRNLLDEFAAYIRSSGTKQVWEWLKKHGLQDEDIIALTRSSAKVESNELVSVNRGKATLNEINRAIASTKGELYVPGSTIKGFIRTAVIYNFLKNGRINIEAEKRNLLNADKQYDKREKRKLRSIAASSIEGKTLRKLKLPMDTGRLTAVNDIMRGIMVSDTTVASNDAHVVVQKTDITAMRKRSGDKETSLPLFREAIPAGTELNFSISIDKNMLQAAGIKGFEDIEKSIASYTRDVLKWQQAKFPDYAYLFKEADTADMLIGAGTGFLSKTLWQAMFPEKQATTLISHLLEEQFRMHKHLALDKEIAPRTLKTVRLGTRLHLAGLCSIREAAEE